MVKLFSDFGRISGELYSKRLKQQLNTLGAESSGPSERLGGSATTLRNSENMKMKVSFVVFAVLK